MTVAAGGPIFCFVVLLKSLMTVVKYVSDGLRDWESQTQLNFDSRPAPQNLTRPQASQPAPGRLAAYDGRPVRA
jgi:hypothetical protein